MKMEILCLCLQIYRTDDEERKREESVEEEDEIVCKCCNS